MIHKLSLLFQKAYALEENVEKAIALLKQNGASQMITTKILISELKISLKEADNIVINSISWSNEKEYVLKIRDKFSDILNSFEEP